jgi:hypothetical protein
VGTEGSRTFRGDVEFEFVTLARLFTIRDDLQPKT